MFSLKTSQPHEIIGTIRCHAMPQHIGPMTDAEGKRWDIHGIFDLQSGQFVQACPLGELHPYFTDTSGAWFGFVSQRWLPYRIELTASEASDEA